MKLKTIVLSSVAGLVGLIVLLSSWAVVPPGHMGILVTLGKTSPGALQPGVHFKTPMVSSIINMSVRVNKYTVAESAQSLDLQDIHTTVAVNFHVEPKDVAWVFTHVGTEQAMSDKVLVQRVSKVFKSVIAKYNAEELTQKRGMISTEIRDRLYKSMLAYRTLIDGVNITNFAFTPQFHAAIERKQIAQQKAQQAQYELERAKVKAQERIVKAAADQKAIQLVQSALTPTYVKYLAVQKWDGKLPRVSTGGSNTMLNLGAATK